MQWATTVAISAPVISYSGNRIKLSARFTVADATMNH